MQTRDFFQVSANNCFSNQKKTLRSVYSRFDFASGWVFKACLIFSVCPLICVFEFGVELENFETPEELNVQGFQNVEGLEILKILKTLKILRILKILESLLFQISKSKFIRSQIHLCLCTLRVQFTKEICFDIR